MGGAVVEAEGLTKVYEGGVLAVDGVSFSVAEGEIFGFLGPNGAGKTTTIKMLVTLLRPTGGSARVCGHDVVGSPNLVRRCVGIVFQDPALDRELTGRENLDYHARMYGLPREIRERRIGEVLDLVGLRERADWPVKRYSGGMMRRLELARGLMHYPRVLFLDEPTLGLDAQTRRAIWDYILTLKREEGVSIFLTTHYMEEADRLCDRVAIIDRGRILVSGAPGDLKSGLGGGGVLIARTPDPDGLAAVVGDLWGGARVTLGEGEVVAYVDDPGRRVPDLVRAADSAGVPLDSVEIRRPSLEDVYLRYTGRRIREEEASPAEVMRARMRARMRGR